MNNQKSAPNNPEKFQPITQNPEIILYAASWCGHCQKLFPEWDKFNLLARSKYPKLKITTIRCDLENNKLTCQQAGIPGYPTIILKTQSNTQIPFNGDRTAEALLIFLQQNTQ